MSSCVYFVTFTVGAMLAAVGGALTAPMISVQPGIGAEMIVLAFAVVVIGGLGSLPGAALGALMVGLVRVGRSSLTGLNSTVRDLLGHGGRAHHASKGPVQRAGGTQDMTSDAGGTQHMTSWRRQLAGFLQRDCR